MANERDKTIRVRLASDLYGRLEQMADRHGMPVATFAAVAVARFVVQEENTLAATRIGVLEASRKMVGTLMDGIDMDALMRAAEGASLELSHAKNSQVLPPADAGA